MRKRGEMCEYREVDKRGENIVMGRQKVMDENRKESRTQRGRVWVNKETASFSVNVIHPSVSA